MALSSSEWRREIFSCCSSFTVLILMLVLIIILILTKDHSSNTTRNGKDCNEYTHSSNTGEIECVNRNKSRAKRYPLYVPLLWMGFTMLLILIRVYKIVNKSRESHPRQPRRRQDWVLERPVVAVSTVSRDYNIGDATASPSAPPDTITLPPGEEDAPPPEYLPPPTYNECVINMDNYDYHSTSRMSRII
ncbi:unnamed protein product [Orchesella dallaii]|uniref:Transmembrane protein n=1 Tax=Orchesella dallaii TaxID=48710 RepID=A0ABP1S848_9HEXA